VIADEYVDREFGTGALKVTPGHDFNDYELARRHDLPLVNILNKDATINENGGPYRGLDRFECREKLWADMEAQGLTIRVEDHKMVVPRAQRGGEIVEPMISTQWFVKIQPLAEKAIAAVRDGSIRIIPERFEKTYFHWLENIEDWCISRQLWWGHRIPAWHAPDGEVFVGRTPPNDGRRWTEDEDVLDTWFSSGLWPFSTLGWPEDTPDMQRFYPTSVMETGYDILFFWVARMIMLGLWFTDRPPFHTVYLHGLVRDKHGRKISKTLGNVIDPLDLIEKYGTDPLRLALVTGSSPGNDINLDTGRVERNWRFVNKIWQMSNFVLQNLEGEADFSPPDRSRLDLPSRWILSRLNRLVMTVQRLFDSFQFGEAARQLDDFLWGEFADWYIEISKSPLYNGTDEDKRSARRVLLHVLDTSLRLLHPYMPFVTEELWRYLPKHADRGEALIIASWPKADASCIDDESERVMSILIDLIRGVRNVRDQYGVEPGRKISALAAAGETGHLLRSHAHLFARLCNIHDLRLLGEAEEAPANSASVIVADVTLYLPLADFIDVDAECSRLTKELARLNEMIARSEATLANEQFINRARPEIVEKERAKLAEMRAGSAQVQERLAQLCS
ncbi:valine--tRNA ligase, partial [Anaerolineae bacterium CFX9]|nr:valine--tRNA ligase [Anaerolineae bacterium CFX9]